MPAPPRRRPEEAVTASKRRKINERKPIVISISHELGKIPSLDSSCNRSARSPIVKDESPPPFSIHYLSSAPKSNNNPTLLTYASDLNPSLPAHESASQSAHELTAMSITASAAQLASELAPQSITASASQSTNASASQSQASEPNTYHHEHFI